MGRLAGLVGLTLGATAVALLILYGARLLGVSPTALGEFLPVVVGLPGGIASVMKALSAKAPVK